jgi:transcription elongation factor GreB
MSKAFTKESDDEQEDNDRPDILSSSTKNYVTPIGFSLLQDELRHLLNDERPTIVTTLAWAASNGDRSENGDYIYSKKRLREIDRRVRYLTKRLESAQVVDPNQQKHLTKVFFGATVTYAQSDKTELTVQIVGIDEADLTKGKISWISPVAKALLKAEVGDAVKLRTPTGTDVLKILQIKY